MIQALAAVDARTLLDRCAKDPEFFFREVLGDDPTAKQVEIADSVRDNRTTAVPSCHASGKSWDAARIALWFLYCHPEARVITTAPTSRQVEGILWSEIAHAHGAARVPLGGDLTTTRLKLEPNWYAWGFTAPDYDPNRFQGFHAPHVLVIEDEAAGISKNISDQIDSLMTGPHPRRLKIGNPVEANTPFQASCESQGVNTIHISAYDTPNFTAFGITEADMRSGDWRKKVPKDPTELPVPFLIDPWWVADRLEIWGPDSNVYRSRIKGLFPETVEGAYYGKALVAARNEGRIGLFPYDAERPVITACDIGISDWTAFWFVQMHGSVPYVIDYEEGNNEGLLYWLDLLKEKPYRYLDHIAPHDMRQREFSTGRTVAAVAADNGVNFRVLPQTNFKEGSEAQNRIELGRTLLARARFNEETTEDGRTALANYTQKKNQRTGELLGIPDHNWASHGADAWGYLAVGLQVAPRVTRPPQPTRKRV